MAWTPLLGGLCAAVVFKQVLIWDSIDCTRDLFVDGHAWQLSGA